MGSVMLTYPFLHWYQLPLMELFAAEFFVWLLLAVSLIRLLLNLNLILCQIQLDVLAKTACLLKDNIVVLNCVKLPNSGAAGFGLSCCIELL